MNLFAWAILQRKNPIVIIMIESFATCREVAPPRGFFCDEVYVRFCCFITFVRFHCDIAFT
jgi:hypothetical protein